LIDQQGYIIQHGSSKRDEDTRMVIRRRKSCL
jgi:hypothetical protein